MDRMDSQIHFGPGGIDAVLAWKDALGVRASLVHHPRGETSAHCPNGIGISFTETFNPAGKAR